MTLTQVQDYISKGDTYYTSARLTWDSEGVPIFDTLVPPIKILNIMPMMTEPTKAIVVTVKNDYIQVPLNNRDSNVFTDEQTAKIFYATHLFVELDNMRKDRKTLMEAYERKLDAAELRLSNEIKAQTIAKD